MERSNVRMMAMKQSMAEQASLDNIAELTKKNPVYRAQRKAEREAQRKADPNWANVDEYSSEDSEGN